MIFEKARKQIRELGLSKELTDELIEVVDRNKILELLNKDELTIDDYNFLMFAGSANEESYDTDIIHLINELSYRARHQSHGAAIVSKVFIPSDLYNQILLERRLDNCGGMKCYIAGALIIPSQYLVAMPVIIGICKPKFKNVSSKQLVFLGRMRPQQGD